MSWQSMARLSQSALKVFWSHMVMCWTRDRTSREDVMWKVQVLCYEKQVASTKGGSCSG